MLFWFIWFRVWPSSSLLWSLSLLCLKSSSIFDSGMVRFNLMLLRRRTRLSNLKSKSLFVSTCVTFAMCYKRDQKVTYLLNHSNRDNTVWQCHIFDWNCPCVAISHHELVTTHSAIIENLDIAWRQLACLLELWSREVYNLFLLSIINTDFLENVALMLSPFLLWQSKQYISKFSALKLLSRCYQVLS